MNLSEQIIRNLNNKERLCEQANIGTTEDCFNVYIATNSPVETPYFIYSATDLDAFYSAICLEKTEYVYDDCLSQALRFSQREKLVKFLQEPDDTEPKKTRWQVLLIEWNRNNPNNKIDTNLKMPNYMNL